MVELERIPKSLERQPVIVDGYFKYMKVSNNIGNASLCIAKRGWSIKKKNSPIMRVHFINSRLRTPENNPPCFCDIETNVNSLFRQAIQVDWVLLPHKSSLNASFAVSEQHSEGCGVIWVPFMPLTIWSAGVCTPVIEIKRVRDEVKRSLYLSFYNSISARFFFMDRLQHSFFSGVDLQQYAKKREKYGNGNNGGLQKCTVPKAVIGGVYKSLPEAKHKNANNHKCGKNENPINFFVVINHNENIPIKRPLMQAVPHRRVS
ncbi:MAG: hypothetical protein ABJN40_05880 [Sneathiella sp.]